MVRSLLACVGLLAFVSPILTAQQKVCVFQAKKGTADPESDAAAVADELDAHSVQAVAATGISSHNENAEARKRGCSWVVRVWREEPPPANPVYPGEAAPGSLSAVTTEMAASMRGREFFNFKLRKAGTRKITARGYFQGASPYTKISGQIAKKIDNER